MTAPEASDLPPPIHEEVRARAVGGAKWTVLDKWGSRLLSFVTFALLAYLLSPEAFGVVAAALVVMALVQTLTEQGISATLIVQDRDDRETRSTAFWMALTAGALGAVALWAAAPLIATVMQAPDLTIVLPVLASLFVLRGLNAVPDALMQRRLEFKGLALRTIGAGLVSSLVAIVLAVLGYGVWALVAQMLVQAAVSGVLAWVATRFRPTFRLSLSTARGIFRFGWKVLVVDLLTVGVSQGDKFVVGALMGPVALGYYTVAFRIVGVLIDAFTGVMSSMATPVFARLKHDKQYTIQALSKVTRTSLVVTVPAFGLLLIVAPLLVPLVFGGQWEPSVPVLQALCIGGMISSVTYFDRGVLYAAGRADLEILAVAVMAVGTLVAATIGAQFGLFAVAVALTIRMLLTLPVRLGVLKIALGMDLWPYLVAWRAPVSGAGVLFAVAAVLAYVLRGEGLTTQLLWAAAGGGVAYVLWVLLVDRRLLGTFVRIVRP